MHHAVHELAHTYEFAASLVECQRRLFQVNTVEVLRLYPRGRRTARRDPLHQARQRCGEPDEDDEVSDIEQRVGVCNLPRRVGREPLDALQASGGGRETAHGVGEFWNEEHP